jgi:hypothetical protein
MAPLVAPFAVAEPDAAAVLLVDRVPDPVAALVEDAVPEGVNTPPDGSCARHALAATEASSAVLGAMTGIASVSRRESSPGKCAELTVPHCRGISAKITGIGSSILSFIIGRENVGELDRRRAEREGSVYPACSVTCDGRATCRGVCGSKEGAGIARERTDAEISFLTKRKYSSRSALVDSLCKCSYFSRVICRGSCNDTRKALFVQAVAHIFVRGRRQNGGRFKRRVLCRGTSAFCHLY